LLDETTCMISFLAEPPNKRINSAANCRWICPRLVTARYRNGRSSPSRRSCPLRSMIRINVLIVVWARILPTWPTTCRTVMGPCFQIAWRISSSASVGFAPESRAILQTIPPPGSCAEPPLQSISKKRFYPRGIGRAPPKNARQKLRTGCNCEIPIQIPHMSMYSVPTSTHCDSNLLLAQSLEQIIKRFSGFWRQRPSQIRHVRLQDRCAPRTDRHSIQSFHHGYLGRIEN